MLSRVYFFREIVNLISLLKFVIKEANEDLISTSRTLGGTEKGEIGLNKA
jgi:hypothetical protein